MDTTTTSSGEKRRDTHKRHIIGAILWVIGLIMLVVASVLIHAHPGPWPVELAFSVSGTAIFAGPAVGVALVVALASPISAWGVWMWKPWAHQRTVLLEIISLAIGVFELIEPNINRGVPLARMILAVLILICLYAENLSEARGNTRRIEEEE